MPRAELENVYAQIVRQAVRTPTATALRYGDTVVSYRSLLEQIQRVGHAITDQTRPQDVVGVYLDNSPEFLYVYFGILATGRICEAIETRTSPVHLREKIEFSRPAFIVASAKYAQKLARLGTDQRVVSFEELVEESVEEVAADTPAERSAALVGHDDLDAPCMVKYTSGTTGNPKPMHIRQRAVAYIVATLVETFSITDQDAYYLLVPMQFLEGLGWICAVLSAGGSIVIAENTFDYGAVLSDAARHRITLLSAVPLTLKIFVQHYMSDLQAAAKTVRVLCTSSAAMPPHITERILTETELDFYTDYGLNEAPRVTFFRYRDFPDAPTSIGFPSDRVQLTLVSESGSLITEAQQHGEICIAGPQVIAGYLGDNLATQRTIRDDVLHTGDFGYRDHAGLLYLVGRSNDVVNIGGEKVALSEIDHVVSMVDGLVEAGCVAMEDELRDFVIDAYIVLAEGIELTRELQRNLKIHCKEHLESYKVPRKFVAIEELPKTSLGKLQRKRLKQLINDGSTDPS